MTTTPAPWTSTIIQNTRRKEYVSRSDYWEIVESSKGQTVQFGSPKSDTLIRIYDKAREWNCPAGKPIVV